MKGSIGGGVMVLMIELALIAGLTSALCSCGHTQSASNLVARVPRSSRGAGQMTDLVAQLGGFRATGWTEPRVYDLHDLVPPLHISIAERGSGATGAISTTGRSNRWQLETWQVTTIAPLDQDPDFHVHLNCRIPVGRRKHSLISRPRDRP